MLIKVIRPVCFLFASVTAAFAVDATPPECLSEGYGDTFLEAPRGAPFECHTLYRLPFSSGGAPRMARIIEDVHAETRVPPATLAALERGVDAAIMTFSSLRSVSLQHVSILAYDGVSPRRDPRGEIQAVTNGSAGAEECTITYYLRADMLGATEVAIAIAHEIFHCMQYATLSAAQMNTYGAGGDWWVEGVAEALADLALPGSGEITDRSDAFADAVRAQTPLNAMTHQSTPFFQWLIATKGVQGMLAFQANMAGAGSVAAQHGAMRAAMPERADWQGFVQAYSDNALTGADGARLADPAPDLPPLDFTETREVALTRAPFVLNYGPVRYNCGEWANTFAPTGLAALKVGEVWADWPASIEGFAEDAAPMKFAALNTGETSAEHTLTATLETPCGACGETEAIDACLVGNWVMTGGGPIEWMRANGMPATVQVEASQMAVQMRRNGGYTTAPMTASVIAENDGVVIEGVGEGLPGLGKWSAEAGILSICPNPGGGVNATATVDGRQYMNFFTPPGDIQMDYTCEGATMVTRMQVAPGLPPIESIFTRQ